MNGRREHLTAVYRRFLTSPQISKNLAARMSCPLLIAVGPRWETAVHRILFVGQETFGWAWKQGDYYAWPHPPLTTLADCLDHDHSIDALIYGYSAFAFSKHQPSNYNSPFWRAFRLIFDQMNRHGDCDMLWTNLFRCDFDGQSVIGACTAAEIRQVLAFQHGLLKAEIRTLRPTAVLFFTGPDYDFALREEFQGVVMRPAGGKTERQFAWLRHPCLPEMTARTYHPAYLRRNRKRWSWLPEIIESMKSATAN